MSAGATTEDLDVKILLGAIYQRLNLLAQDMGLLKLAILERGAPAPSPGAFSSLGGAWRGIEISEQDIGEARISLPGDL
jgi:hypothetical protein